MEYLIVGAAALIGSALTFFSGFGLGTLLVPVFGLFFPIETAIALTAAVHFLNNIFKLILVGKHADKEVLIKFGIPSALAAIAGAALLGGLTDLPALYSYNLSEKLVQVSPLKLIIGIVIGFFALFELVPALSKLEFDKKYLPLGGLLSGFFGGLSGNQGALRSAFLSRSGLKKEAFVATGTSIACLIDVSRLSIYTSQIGAAMETGIDYGLPATACVCAFIGAYFGKNLLKKTTILSMQYAVGGMMLVFAVLLCLGII